MAADTDALTDADRVEISDLAATYAHAVDRRDFDLLRDVFVDAAVLDTGTATRTGVDEILAAMDRLRRYESTFHILGQQRIRGGPNTASGETYCEAHHLSTDGDRSTDWIMKIRYIDDLVRTELGWRITTRRLEVDWTETRRLD